jgi:hypothetical protein
MIPLVLAGILGCQPGSGDAASEEQSVTMEPATTVSGDVQNYYVVPDRSLINWEGYKPAMGVTHEGIVRIREGSISVKDGMIRSGKIVIDMTTLTSTDQTGQGKERLETHLKGTAPGKEDDFFNVSQFPVATFEITRSASLSGDAEANMLIYGNLTIKGITRNVGLKALVNTEAGELRATAPLFKLDRTEWGIKVLSKKYFENLKDNFVSDEFGLRIELNAAEGKDI